MDSDEVGEKSGTRGQENWGFLICPRSHLHSPSPMKVTPGKVKYVSGCGTNKHEFPSIPFHSVAACLTNLARKEANTTRIEQIPSKKW